MSVIRKLNDDDLANYVDIAARAYPGFDLFGEEAQEQVLKRFVATQHENPTVDYYGLFRDGELVGGMRLHDFRMQMFETRIPAGGLGMVAVHLAHKKEKVAKELMTFFLDWCREHEAYLAVLYPFRPDFYKRMGFGLGSQIHQYRLRPDSFPKGSSKSRVALLGEADREAAAACYDRVLARTHGLMTRNRSDWDRVFTNSNVHVVGVKDGNLAQGYLMFAFEKGSHFIQNDLVVRELIYETPEALAELCTFLHSQADQIRHVVLNTQDEHIFRLLGDPRDNSNHLIPSVYHQSNVSGVGIMYRVVDTAGLLAQMASHSFGGRTLQLKVTVADSFYPSNHGSTVIHFRDGAAQVMDPAAPHQVEVWWDVADWSALLVGAIPFRHLVRYGLARISDPAYVEAAGALFEAADRPICFTDF